MSHNSGTLSCAGLPVILGGGLQMRVSYFQAPHLHLSLKQSLREVVASLATLPGIYPRVRSDCGRLRIAYRLVARARDVDKAPAATPIQLPVSAGSDEWL